MLILAALITFMAFLSCVALHEYLYSFDPYGWAFPGKESDVSRSLFLERAQLYRVVGVISFMLTLVLSGAAWISGRSERRLKIHS
ncbi:MAG TPA: hypothetical protein VGO68_13935 [Pyrinomonadaceae bacterium]|jgi:hypothetical protein|nr:hypothetical protein [Pyrinomonadaceae bacterium]